MKIILAIVSAVAFVVLPLGIIAFDVLEWVEILTCVCCPPLIAVVTRFLCLAARRSSLSYFELVMGIVGIAGLAATLTMIIYDLTVA